MSSTQAPYPSSWLSPRLAHFAASPLPREPASLGFARILRGTLENPARLLHPQNRTTYDFQHLRPPAFHCRSSPRAISTGQLHASPHFHFRPINQVVFLGPYSIKDERSHLRGSFTLRCLQRLSRPYIATQLCPWQDNWCTRGTSIPVLSY